MEQLTENIRTVALPIPSIYDNKAEGKEGLK